MGHSSEPPKVGSKWRHKGRGLVYEVLFNSAMLQCSGWPEIEDVFDDTSFVVYRNIKTALVVVRPLPEFMDGRFLLVEDADV